MKSKKTISQNLKELKKLYPDLFTSQNQNSLIKRYWILYNPDTKAETILRESRTITRH